MVFSLPKLPYAYDALEPHIDAQTMEIHHTRHHAGYVANLNKAIEGYDLGEPTIEDLVCSIHSLPDKIRDAVRDQGGGHTNHSLLWTVISPRGGGEPSGDLLGAIRDDLGGFDRFREMLTGAAMHRFGSGWAWLSLNPDRKLLVEDTPNQDSPLMHGHTPILGIDVWEHAYYLKYQNRRADYVNAFFKVIDWEAVTRRYLEALKHIHLVHSV
jgi:Fe-Mn family superoxide dismutase